jgi:uncharacterized protein
VRRRLYRAWRFLHPDLDVSEPFAGLQVSPTGGIDMVEEHSSVRQAVLLLLSTRPGERVMRPDYGCDIHRLVFWPNDDTTAGLAIHYVRLAIARWEPRIDVVRLQAGRSTGDPGRLEVDLHYRVRGTGRADFVSFNVTLTGEAA